MELNYAALAFAENLKRNPDLFENITNPEKLNKQLADSAKERQALDAKNAVHRKDSPRAEYNKLRKELFDAQEWAKHAEIYANDKAGVVKLLEQRINDLIKQKKAAVDNPLAERNCEHQIQLLETELLDAKAEFNRAKVQSGNAARGLKNFSGHQRIAELKAELERPIGKE
jgi:hypothetical protein